MIPTINSCGRLVFLSMALGAPFLCLVLIMTHVFHFSTLHIGNMFHVVQSCFDLPQPEWEVNSGNGLKEVHRKLKARQVPVLTTF